VNDLPPPPAKTPLWRTAGGLSAIAAIATVIVSAIGLVATFGGDDGVGPTAPLGVGPSTGTGTRTASGPPSLTRQVFSDSLEDASSGFEAFATSSACSSGYEGHYRVGVDIRQGGPQSPFCIERSRSEALASLEDVRFEVTARWIELPPNDLRDSGRAAVGLTCYSNGLADTGTHYDAVITTNGTWAIDRQYGGDENVAVLDRGRRSDGWSADVGDVVRLRLDCWAEEEGVYVEFWVDGERLGKGFDPDPLPTSGIGLLVWGFSPGRAEAEFSNLEVYSAAE